MLSLITPWGAGAAVGSAVATAAEKLAGAVSFAQVLRSDSTADAPTAEPSADSPAALREQLARKQADLQTKIAARLREAGIPLEQPLELEADPFGDLRLVDGHPAAGQIEFLINSDPAMREELAELQALRTEVDRLDLLQRGERLHDLDPLAANELRRLARQHQADPPRLLIGREG